MSTKGKDTNSKEQTVTLSEKKQCKHSVAFEYAGDGLPKVASSFYLMRPAYEALGKPKSIQVTVTKVS